MHAVWTSSLLLYILYDLENDEKRRKIDALVMCLSQAQLGDN